MQNNVMLKLAVQEIPRNEPIALKVVIDGDGIGGLAAIIECKEKGFEITVLKSSKEFTHVTSPKIVELSLDRGTLCD